jgi:hypothetical protein
MKKTAFLTACILALSIFTFAIAGDSTSTRSGTGTNGTNKYTNATGIPVMVTDTIKKHKSAYKKKAKRTTKTDTTAINKGSATLSDGTDARGSGNNGTGGNGTGNGGNGGVGTGRPSGTGGSGSGSGVKVKP